MPRVHVVVVKASVLTRRQHNTWHIKTSILEWRAMTAQVIAYVMRLGKPMKTSRNFMQCLVQVVRSILLH